jgi:hypothetical protein
MTIHSKSKKTKPNKRTLEAQARHDQWLASMGVTERKKLKGVEHTNLRAGLTENAKLTNGIAGNGSKKEANVYTGDYVKGIATMHKSNAVPITSGQQAIEVAQMRRS